uniref:Uncharacterized protein n=1 Tax=Arundo donax TaxID=35708 RepID=A0A0A9EV22_ARUDO
MLKQPCTPFMHAPKPSRVPSPRTHLSPAFPPVPAHVDAPRPLPTPNHFPKTVPGPTSQMMPIPSPSLPVFQHPMPPRKKRNKRPSKFPAIAPSPYALLHT